MKNYAHPIEGQQGKWCNMPKATTEKPQEGAGEVIDAEAMTGRGFITAYEQLGFDHSIKADNIQFEI